MTGISKSTLNNFNPRSREGSDRSRGSDSIALCPFMVGVISIHAPAKGATIHPNKDMIDIVISIHAPAKGATVRAGCICLHSAYFNPRSREGSDNTVHFVIAFCIISIHAPAKGATLRIFHLFCNSQNFNPRSREGSDDF